MTRARIAGLVLTHLLGAALLAALAPLLLHSAPSISGAVSGLVLIGALLGTGWLLAAKLPRNPVGWLLLVITAFFVAEGPVTALADALRTGALGAAGWLYWFAGDDGDGWSWLPPVWTLLIWLPLHFPDGALPSPRWRWFSAFTLLELAYALVVFATITGPSHGFPNPVAVPAIADAAGPLLLVSAVLAATCFAGTVVSLVVRYRSGGATVRAQVRWMAWSVAIATGLLVIGWALPSSDAFDDWTLTAYGLIPISIAVAVLRYRLYEIDRIISRTAAYLLLTLTVVGVYLFVVLAVAQVSLLLPGLPDLGVPLATLAAAAVFLPALRLLRRALDRVFDRAQYDAQRVVDAFGERLRTGADPHTAGRDLAAAVESTLQPTVVGIWTADRR